MKLRNNFPEEVRLVYLYTYACEDCGRSDKGLEIHHILGRCSSCFLNSIVLCKDCHSRCGHSFKEEQIYLNYRIRTLYNYSLKEEDVKFYLENKRYYTL